VSSSDLVIYFVDLSTACEEITFYGMTALRVTFHPVNDGSPGAFELRGSLTRSGEKRRGAWSNGRQAWVSRRAVASQCRSAGVPSPGTVSPGSVGPGTRPSVPHVAAPHGSVKELRMKHRVCRLALRMSRDQHKLKQFLNGLEGEVVSIIPNLTLLPATTVDFLLTMEKVG
jgi:hypothetical protein